MKDRHAGARLDPDFTARSGGPEEKEPGPQPGEAAPLEPMASNLVTVKAQDTLDSITQAAVEGLDVRQLLAMSRWLGAQEPSTIDAMQKLVADHPVMDMPDLKSSSDLARVRSTHRGYGEAWNKLFEAFASPKAPRGEGSMFLG